MTNKDLINRYLESLGSTLVQGDSPEPLLSVNIGNNKKDKED